MASFGAFWLTFFGGACAGHACAASPQRRCEEDNGGHRLQAAAARIRRYAGRMPTPN